MSEDTMVIHRVENGWLLTVGDSAPGKPPARRMVTTNPDHLGVLAADWANKNPPLTYARPPSPAIDPPAGGILDLDPLRFGVAPEGKAP